MLVDYNKFKKISKKIDYKYFKVGLPFGSLRIFSEDENGIEHSLVLTRDEVCKWFGKGTYLRETFSDEVDYKRLFNVKPFYEYKELEC